MSLFNDDDSGISLFSMKKVPKNADRPKEDIKINEKPKEIIKNEIITKYSQIYESNIELSPLEDDNRKKAIIRNFKKGNDYFVIIFDVDNNEMVYINPSGVFYWRITNDFVLISDQTKRNWKLFFTKQSDLMYFTLVCYSANLQKQVFVDSVAIGESDIIGNKISVFSTSIEGDIIWVNKEISLDHSHLICQYVTNKNRGSVSLFYLDSHYHYVIVIGENSRINHSATNCVEEISLSSIARRFNEQYSYLQRKLKDLPNNYEIECSLIDNPIALYHEIEKQIEKANSSNSALSHLSNSINELLSIPLDATQKLLNKAEYGFKVLSNELFFYTSENELTKMECRRVSNEISMINYNEEKIIDELKTNMRRTNQSIFDELNSQICEMKRRYDQLEQDKGILLKNIQTEKQEKQKFVEYLHQMIIAFAQDVNESITENCSNKKIKGSIILKSIQTLMKNVVEDLLYPEEEAIDE